MFCGTQFLVICIDALETHLGKNWLFSDQATYFQKVKISGFA